MKMQNFGIPASNSLGTDHIGMAVACLLIGRKSENTQLAASDSNEAVRHRHSLAKCATRSCAAPGSLERTMRIHALDES